MHHYARFLQIGSHIRMYPTVILVFHGKYYKSDMYTNLYGLLAGILRGS